MSESKMVNEQSLEPFLESLKKIFEAMNAKYDAAASFYGFQCNGCDENCCQTLFYHYTYLEFFYLKKGVNQLSAETKKHVFERSVKMGTRSAQNEDSEKKPPRIMCPANIKGRCVVYEYRPMICRLHGIPSEWRFPQKNGMSRAVIGSGCEKFSRQCSKKEYFKFDRTPLYLKLSALEKQLKEHFGLEKKIKMTVAQIITS